MSMRVNIQDGASVVEIATMAELMIRWTECLHGAGSLREILGKLADVMQARVVQVHRQCLTTGLQRTVAGHDLGSARGARPMVRGLGKSLIDADPTTIIPGKVWTLGELSPVQQDRLDPRVTQWMQDRGLCDAAVIPLGLSDGRMDIFEFYSFAPMSARSSRSELLARMMATGWQRRNEGHVAQLLQADRVTDTRADTDPGAENPLALSNPWGLTAAEMRICALIQAGTDPADIGGRLSVSASTVRTHLRSIYAKGQVSGQVGLVRQLVTSGTPVEHGLVPRAVARRH